MGEAIHQGPPLTRLRRLRLVESQAQSHSPAPHTLVSSDDEPLVPPTMFGSGSSPTVPGYSFPTVCRHVG